MLNRLVVAVTALSTMVTANKFDVAFPMQHFYLPVPEDDAFAAFLAIRADRVSGNVHTSTSISIAMDNTVIWYDQYEDGYEADVTSDSIAATTLVWGDGDASNGCNPNIDVALCTDADDVFTAGDVILLSNWVDPTNMLEIDDDGNYKFGGRDMIAASGNVQIARGSYPEVPSVYLGGAVEVWDTTKWGTTFQAPIGIDVTETPPGGVDNAWDGFSETAFHVMSGTDGTVVTITEQDGTTVLATVTLNIGETYIFEDVKAGYQLFSTEAVQVDLLSGDTGSRYEMRWYSLLDTNKWSNAYLSAVGDTKGLTKTILYNPIENSGSITITCQEGDPNSASPLAPYDVVLAPGQASWSHTIDDGHGLYMHSVGGENFMAFSVTDTDTSHQRDIDDEANITSGWSYDWGYPVQPISELTTQVVIGWGYGCTDTICDSKGHTEARSYVWLAPLEDGTFYIDYNNDGETYDLLPATQYSSYKVTDPEDHDMTAAKITFYNTNGDPARFASAWGQDPANVVPGDRDALDLGTTVNPFPEIVEQVFCALEDDADGNGVISAGDTIAVYTRKMNTADYEYEGIPPRDYVDTIVVRLATEGDGACQFVTVPSPTPTPSPHPGVVNGDPHFWRWHQKRRDSFMGECDLVMIHSDDFDHGAGLDIHVRTTIRTFYSYVEEVAVRMGEDVVVMDNKQLFVNGQLVEDEHLPMDLGADETYELFKVTDYDICKGKRMYRVRLKHDEDTYVTLRSFRHYLAAEVNGDDFDLGSSVGLLGDYTTGAMVARDGSIMTDFEHFGHEWQVRPELDGQLFHTVRAPQHPTKCIMPTVQKASRRRLRSSIDPELLEAAQEACAIHGAEHMELCVDDIVATGDLELATVW